MTWSKEILAKNLRHYMEYKGITQKELSEIVGVSAPTVNEWLKAKKYPRIDKIEIMANYFGILKSDLIEDKIVSPDEWQLTEGEKTIIKLFRQVPEDKQSLVLQMLQALVNTR